MNPIIFVVCVSFVVTCNSQDLAILQGRMGEDIQKYLDDCKAENGSTEEDIKNYMAHNKTPSKSIWCFTACMKKKTGMMDANNKINLNKLIEDLSGMKAALPELFAKTSEVLTACKIEMEADPKNLANQCTAAQVFETCIRSKKEPEEH